MRKKIFVAAAMVAVAIGMQAQGIIINKTDGTFEVFPADEVVSIVTYGYGEEPQPGEGNTLTFNVAGVSFNMVQVEGGTFQMGCDDSDAGTYEQPVHEVTLSSFSIGQTEVTQALWYAVMGQKPTADGEQWTQWSATNGLGNSYPAYGVSWDDCQEFITKLNMLTGKQFRLPTEAEWEFAARGGTKSKGYKYAGSNNIDNVAWYTVNSFDNLYGDPDYGSHEVATMGANELGIYDMSGNVQEWCYDWFGSYHTHKQIDPRGPSTGNSRILRGGCWIADADHCRATYRSLSSTTNRSTIFGLRLALSEETTGEDVPAEPKAIDLGLPSGTLWADLNIGASSPRATGGYYAFGETEEKATYSWDSYMCSSSQCAYSSDPLKADGILRTENSGSTILQVTGSIAGTKYDVATQTWGEEWVMPTKQQYQELYDNCTRAKVEIAGVQCTEFTGPNGNSILFPGGGYKENTETKDASYSYCWTAEVNSILRTTEAIVASVSSGGFNPYGANYRYLGMPVRPVKKK